MSFCDQKTTNKQKMQKKNKERGRERESTLSGFSASKEPALIAWQLLTRCVLKFKAARRTVYSFGLT